MKVLSGLALLGCIFTLLRCTSCCNKPSPAPGPAPRPRGCCDDIGDERICFLPYKPKCPYQFHPTFTLYNKDTPEKGIPIERKKDIPPEFTNNRRTAFIVHGWRDSFEGAFVDLKNALLNKDYVQEDWNVIGVDWEKGAGNLLTYPIGATNTRVIGALIGEYTNFLRTKPGSSPYFWCIGHSLGAQSCGFSELTANALLDRITGLDPAGPLFGSCTGVTKNSASQVDIIHTSDWWGSDYPRGHVDFYPNSGEAQPDCPFYGRSESYTDEELIQMMEMEMRERGAIGCSHGKAVTYMIESVKNPHCYMATHKCNNFESLPDSCQQISSASDYGVMGYDAPNHRYSDILYFESEQDSPYCAIIP